MQGRQLGKLFVGHIGLIQAQRFELLELRDVLQALRVPGK
jgi:hypothetical protein